MISRINPILTVLVTLLCADMTAANEIVAVEEWTFSEFKGKNTFFAAHHVPQSGKPMTEAQRSAIRKALVDSESNANVPFLANPVTLSDGLSGTTKVSVILYSESRDSPEALKGVALFEHTNDKNTNTSKCLVWRSTFTDTYTFVDGKVTYIYTVHRNVKLNDGSYLLTLVTIRNSALGVTSYSMSGSAKKLK